MVEQNVNGGKVRREDELLGAHDARDDALGDQSPRPPGIYRIRVESKLCLAGNEQVGVVTHPQLASNPWSGARVASQQSPILRPGRGIF